MSCERLFALLLLLVCLACSGVPKGFDEKANSMLEAGSLLAAKSEQGINYNTLGEEVAKLKAAFDMVPWPEKKFAYERKLVERAIEGYRLAMTLWKLKFDEKDPPVEPDINDFDIYTKYLSKLDIHVYPQTMLVPHYRGKRYLPIDENVAILLDEASRAFTDARQSLSRR